MNRYPFIKIMILDCLRNADDLSGYDIIKFCRGNGIPASSGTVYPHLKSLVEAGVLHCREDGRRKLYGLTERGRTEMEVGAISKAPVFLKNSYFKSLCLAARLDWTSKAGVKMLIDNVEEIKRYLTDYMNNLE
jgi:DNA-binding PadR family transcriptional regulator